MRGMWIAWAGIAALAAPAFAAEPPRIKVIGYGSVETAPDLARIGYSVRGEGATADAATRALVAKRASIEAGLAGFAGLKWQQTDAKLDIEEARAKECDSDDDDDRVRLSTGDCAIKGYVATIGVSMRLSPPDKAGTVVGLIGRLGGSRPSLGSFQIRDESAAKQRAIAAAIANGRAQASAIAVASGQKLGRLLDVTDDLARSETQGEDIVVTAYAPPAVTPPPPVAVAIKPEPIETSARLVMTFELMP